MLHRILNTYSSFDPDMVVGTADQNGTLVLIFKFGGQLILDDKDEIEAAWALLFPDREPVKGDWSGSD